MKYLFIDSYYPNFLKSFYSQYPANSFNNYNQQKKILLEQAFGTADFYSYNLKKLSINADDIIANDLSLQNRWLIENKINLPPFSIPDHIYLRIPWRRFLGYPDKIKKTVYYQIKTMRPDVIYLHDLNLFDIQDKQKLRKYSRLIVGQIASPLPHKKYLFGFDLIISSFPHYVSLFNKIGIRSEYLPLAFDKRVLDRVGINKRILDTVFIGSVSLFHKKGTRILEKAASSIPLSVWGQGFSLLSPFSPLRNAYQGKAWGLRMYEILSSAKIVINRHIDAAGDNANNLRMYEATGMGAMLITDYKKNLPDLFKIGDEIESYKNSDELIDKLKYYLANENMRRQIAKRGQKRTLTYYNYSNRMGQLLKIINKYI